MATIISVINDKGGVAKTTTVANLGTALWLLGKRVLLVDTDMQCNLTFVMDKTVVNSEHNIMTWMMGPKDAEPPVYERYNGLDFIPSCTSNSSLENYLRAKSAGGDRQFAMRMAMIDKYYDYIIVDCSPGCTSHINTNVLEASNYIIVPIRADIFSVTGREMLLEHVNAIRDLDYDLKILGALITHFEPNTSMGKTIKNYYRSKADMELIPVQIKKSERINQGLAVQQTVFEYAPGSNPADEYMMLAEWMINKLERKTPLPRRKTWTSEAWGKKAKAAFSAFIKRQEEETGQQNKD